MPVISVLMSVFNSEKYIAEAVESVLTQTFSDFEFLIFEDCSKDNSLSILKEYAARDARIKLIVNQSNKGLTANLIQGMITAKGKYLARMDADDICMPERFEKQVEFLEKNKKISVLGSAVIFFDDEGNEIIGKQPINHEEIKVELLLGFTMLHPSVMMRLEDMRKHNLNYNLEYRYSQDFDLWVRSIRVLKFANLDLPLLKMREHPNKISRALKPAQKKLSDNIRFSQLNELDLKFTEQDLAVFNKLGNSESNFTNEELTRLENLLIEIRKSNDNKKNIYDRTILRRSCSQKFTDICYNLLKQKNRTGNYFYKSIYLRSDTPSVKTLLKFSILTFQNYLLK